MFEIPEYVILARQMAESLSGKRIANGTLGNSPHKFVWYNRKPDEFASIVKGKTIGVADSRGRWLFIPIQPGYILVFGECGGKIILHEPGSNCRRSIIFHCISRMVASFQQPPRCGAQWSFMRKERS